MATSPNSGNTIENKLYNYAWEGVDTNNRPVRGETKASSEAVIASTLRRKGIRPLRIKRESLIELPGVKNKGEVKTFSYSWQGIDRNNKVVKGELRAASEAVVATTLRRQGIKVSKVKKQRSLGGKKVSEKDIVFFTRQLSTMLKAGVPLMQAFDIVGQSHSNPRFAKMLLEVKQSIEVGSTLSQAFRRFPLHFDNLYCNLVAAGEQAGILDTLLERLATYKEKILGIKSKIKSALFYPTAVIVVSVVVTAIIMIFVIPSFKQVFSSFGADLPALTLAVIAISDFFVKYWFLIFGTFGGALFFFFYSWKRSKRMQAVMDRLLLQVPVFGEIVRQASIARWSRTLATMFAAGVPLVESLDSVSGAAGNHVYYDATRAIQAEVSTGTSLAAAMTNTHVFPSMVLQMTAIGEESGSLDTMLSKVADFYEREVDDKVSAISSLLEPFIIVFLGVVIGTIVTAMYLPIFKLGQVV